MKNAKMPEFYRKIPLPRVLGAIPDFKAESERTRSQYQLRHHGGHRFSGAIVLNKLFMRHLMLLYSISLDAYRPVTL